MFETTIIPKMDGFQQLTVSREYGDRIYIEIRGYSADVIVELSRPEARRLVKALRWAIDGKVKP